MAKSLRLMDTVVSSGNIRKRPVIDIPRSIYFGGAGWGGGFYVGVYQGLVEIWGLDFATRSSVNISGDSAGVLWAIAVALQFRPDEVDAIFRKQSYRAVAEGQWLGRNTIYLRDVVTELLSRDIKAYQKLEGRFSTATTGFPFEHTRHGKWTSNSDLINCVLGSLHIPFYCSRIKPLKGVNVIDGAYSFCGHHLVHGNETLFIGIDPNAEITRELTLSQMMFPPVGLEYDQLVKSGYEAVMNWDGCYKTKIGTRFANFRVLAMLWPVKFLEILITCAEESFENYLYFAFRLIWTRSENSAPLSMVIAIAVAMTLFLLSFPING